MRALWPVSDVLHALLLAAFALPLQACLVVISTGPTLLHDANIVFVVFDDDGGLVSGARVVVRDAGGQWQQSGHTGRDGVYRCSLGSGVTRVTITLEPPGGYVLSHDRAWPVVLDVESGDSQQVELHVVRTG